jgi:cyclopropane-fatty-acyl-phospholipid synthase
MTSMAAGREKTGLRPDFDNVQAHYDLSDEFFRLFLDPTQTYSCAYFESDDMALEQAQIAKIDLALGKLGLQPGMTLLDIGCGWGATLRRAVQKYDVNVVGLTLSKNQAIAVDKLFRAMDSTLSRRVYFAGWEQFHEPVDRIVSIGAFEHFGHKRYDNFFHHGPLRAARRWRDAAAYHRESQPRGVPKTRAAAAGKTAALHLVHHG